MQTHIANSDKLEPYITKYDKYIVKFLHNKSILVTLYRMLIEFYFKKPFVSTISKLINNDIGKLANTTTMNLTKTSTLDNNLDTTKTLIFQTLTFSKSN